jgi:hypothetical protein
MMVFSGKSNLVSGRYFADINQSGVKGSITIDILAENLGFSEQDLRRRARTTFDDLV